MQAINGAYKFLDPVTSKVDSTLYNITNADAIYVLYRALTELTPKTLFCSSSTKLQLATPSKIEEAKEGYPWILMLLFILLIFLFLF
jgi:hypothetical protein